jgi:hypothetical protein
MNVCSSRNPNVCVDCEALTLDDSPSTLPCQTEAELLPDEFAQPCVKRERVCDRALNQS